MRYTAKLVEARFNALINAHSDVLDMPLCYMRKWNSDGTNRYEFELRFKNGRHFEINCYGSQDACMAIRNVRETLDCMKNIGV